MEKELDFLNLKQIKLMLSYSVGTLNNFRFCLKIRNRLSANLIN